MSASLSSRIGVLLEELVALDCPLTRDLDDSRFSDLAFQPGEWRQLFLRWLLSQIDPRLCQSIEQQLQLSQPRLAHMTAALGLCSLDRSDVITGAARRLDQLAFFEKTVRVLSHGCEVPVPDPTRHPERVLSPIVAASTSSSGSSLSQEPQRSTEDIVAEAEASIDLLNFHLASEALLSQLCGGGGSFLAPDLGLLLRGRVEQRKTDIAASAAPPTTWAMASWREDLEAQEGTETAAVAGSGEQFVSSTEADRLESLVGRLGRGCVRFAAADRRSFAGAIERVQEGAAWGREGDVEAAAVLTAKAEAMEERLAAVAVLARSSETLERALVTLEGRSAPKESVREPGLAREVLSAANS